MKSFLDNIFGREKDKSESGETESYKLQVATAALLLEIARVDEEFTDDEKSVIVDVLKKQFELTSAEVDEIIEATDSELHKRIDLYYFTNQINEHFDKEKKMEIIEMIWRVIYTDQHLNGHEDFLVHRFAKLLRLQHSEMIEVKLRVKNES